jgi:large subunit ribosomal protein L21
MYAVIETGGKQYRVAPGDVIKVEKLDGEVGSAIEFNKVLAVAGDTTLSVGSDVANAKVKGSIAAQGRGDKVIVFKFKRKKQYKRTIGHRQYLTSVKIDEIVSYGVFLNGK